MSAKEHYHKKSIDHSRLPPEIWSLIMREATLTPGGIAHEDGLYRHYFFRHHALFREFRISLVTKRYLVLVSRDWHYLATPFLYERVLIGFASSLPGLAQGLNRPIKEEGDRTLRTGSFVKRIDYLRRDSDARYPDGPQDRIHLPIILSRTPNLETLDFRTNWKTSDAFGPETTRYLFSVMPESLRYFRWDSPLPVQDSVWSSFFKEHPRIEEIVGSFIRYIESLPPDTTCSFPSARALILHSNSPMEAIAAKADLPSIEHLSYHTYLFEHDDTSPPILTDPHGYPSLQALLRKIGERLTSMEIVVDVWAEDGSYPRPTNLFRLVEEFCPRMERIDIVWTALCFIDYTGSDDVACPLPKGVKTLGLRKIGQLSRHELSYILPHIPRWARHREHTTIQFMDRKDVLAISRMRKVDFKSKVQKFSNLGIRLVDDQGLPLAFAER